jgi:uncharacterized protein YndB with AHSA1/START domain
VSSGSTERLSPTELRFERLLDAPVATVWRWIVDPELRARWFMGGPTDLKVDGALGLTMDHDRLSDGPVPTPERYREFAGRSWSERIIRVEPEQLLAFEWNGGAEGLVTITLAAEGDQTRLVLVHSGISGRDSAINFAGGWGAHLAVLERRLTGEPVTSFWELHALAESDAEAKI